MIGWLTSIAWIATLAVGSIFTGTMIQGLIILNYPDYEPKNSHGTFLAWAVIAVSVFVNTVIAGLLPVLEGLILLIHILGFFAIMIPLIYLSVYATASVATVPLSPTDVSRANQVTETSYPSGSILSSVERREMANSRTFFVYRLCWKCGHICW
jgi:hypothetical protein